VLEATISNWAQYELDSREAGSGSVRWPIAALRTRVETKRFGFHIDQQTEKNRRAGMDADEARRQAVIKFGGVERIKTTRATRSGRRCSKTRCGTCATLCACCGGRPGSRRRRW
jgi:hypothetical protein